MAEYDRSERRWTLSLSGICLFFVLLAASVEYQVPASGRSMLSELAVAACVLVVAASAKGRIRVRPAAYVFMLTGTLSLLQLTFRSDDFWTYLPFIKAQVVFAFALIVWDNLLQTRKARHQALKLLVGIAVVISLYSIAQSILGFGVLPDSYNTGGAPVIVQSNFRSIDDTAFKLVGVMKWKAAQINHALGVPVLNGLGYGFHWFSANMAEYLVYAAAAGWLARREGLLSARALAWIEAVIGLAILLSGSRFALAGFLFVNGAYFIYLSKHKVLLGSIVGVAVVLAVAFVDWSVVFFDDGGSLTGRELLNDAALSYIFQGDLSVLFGGDAPSYAAASYSNVHSSLLYLMLYGGLVVSVPFVLAVMYWFIQLSGRAKGAGGDVVFGALVALIWFLAYGMTWAAISLPNTVILVAFFVCFGQARAKSLASAEQKEWSSGKAVGLRMPTVAA